MTDFNTKWSGREAFHEIAEALGVATDHIIAAMPAKDDSVIVTYSQELPDTTGWKSEDWDALKAYGAALRRDGDGILRVVHGPDEMPNYFRDMRLHIEGRMP